MSLVNTAIATGTALVVSDYLNRKYGIAEDIKVASKLLPLQSDVKYFNNHNLTVADLWERSYNQYKNNISIIFEGKQYTFHDVELASNRFAHWALSKGLKRGDVVSLYMENKAEYIITWLGLAKVGIVTALINSNLQGKGLVHCVKISNSKLLIFGIESTANIETAKETLDVEFQKIPYYCFGGKDFPAYAQSLDEELEKFPTTPVPKSTRDGMKASDYWAFVYTSGTTGLPKAAIIKHFRFISTGAFSQMYGVTQKDRIYTALPLYHSAGGMIGAGMMIYSGATLVLRKKFSGKEFIPDIRKYECTVFQYIGELCRYLLAVPPSPEDKNHKIRVAIGNGLRPDIWETFQTRFQIPYIGEFYAATEGNASLFNLVGLDGVGRGGIGRMGAILRAAIPLKIVKFNVETEDVIRGPNGLCIECKPGEVGELIGRIEESDPTRDFVGYYGNKSGTEKKVLKDAFKKGDKWFRSGDLLKIDEKGYYYFVDRIGDTFRWKGENVSTTEVAEIVSLFPGIREANVYGVTVPGADGRAGMAALVLENNDLSKFDFAQLGAHTAKDLPHYAVPLFLRILPEMEITGTFKHRKVELRDQGFNPSQLQDPVFIFNAANKAYERLTPEKYQQTFGAKAKL